MALTFDQTKEAERWLGTVESDESDDLEARITTFGGVVIVASYELLVTRYAELLRSPDELRLEGDARARWVESKKKMEDQLARCLDQIRWLYANARISLNTAAKDLLGPELTKGRGSLITTGVYTSPNPRP